MPGWLLKKSKEVEEQIKKEMWDENNNKRVGG